MDQAPLERIDSFPYRHRVRDVVVPLVDIAAEVTLEQAARRMRDAKVGSVVVLDPAGAPAGILTERDLLTAVGQDGAAALARTMGATMSRPVATVPVEAFVHVAIGRLDRLGIRHLVAVDAAGRAVGIIAVRNLLHLRAGKALALGDEIGAAGTAAALADVQRALPALARGLRAEGVTAAQVGAVIAGVLRDLTARAAELAERELGPPPAPYALLVLGSGGRGESLLAADQDNALVHAPADDRWFAAFGQRVADMLDQAGIPYCQGGVMAARPDWRHTPEDWLAEVGRWVRRAEGEAMLNVDIFFDFARAHGDAGLAEALRAQALRQAADTPLFLRLMAQEVERGGSALGAFGRWRSKQGRVDLKRGGIWPIIAFARALALRCGIAATGTPERLDAAVADGHLRQEDGERLATTFELVLGEILEQQLVDLAAGRAAGNSIELERLSRDRRARLKDALGNLDTLPVLLQDALTA
jgi:CBS domain-containing protein